MTSEDFVEIFEKVYQKKEEKIYVVKIPDGLGFLENNAIALGMAISPCRFVGIRISDEENICIRNTDSNIMYMVKKTEADKCDNCYCNIFKIADKILKTTGIKGVEILLHNECPEIVLENYIQGIITGLFFILRKNITLYDYYPENNQVSLNDIIGIYSLRNNIFAIDNGNISFYPVNLCGYKVIVITCERTGQEIPYDSSVDNIEKAKVCLKSGDLKGFSEVIKDDAREFFLCCKNLGDLETLYNIAVSCSELCGIYKNYGIYLFSEDNVVDEIVKKIDSEFYAGTGKRAEFYICEQNEKTVE